ncbi:MAG TPA: NUDIX domain-containing protein [Caulobacteraceae bacterium]|nr:NUDIX domain-containing protein [Caulobacteraceae bacterium]
MSLRLRFERLIRPFYQAWSRRTRGMTLGVRALVLDGEGRVLLVRHTYSRGWHMPGGGVERGETAALAMQRELMEEAGIKATAPLVLVSIHSAEAHFRGDHILFFRVPAWEACAPTQTGEIAEAGWFSPDALPEGTTAGTRKRIAEALANTAAHPHW